MYIFILEIDFRKLIISQVAYGVLTSYIIVNYGCQLLTSTEIQLEMVLLVKAGVCDLVIILLPIMLLYPQEEIVGMIFVGSECL